MQRDTWLGQIPGDVGVLACTLRLRGLFPSPSAPCVQEPPAWTVHKHFTALGWRLQKVPGQAAGKCLVSRRLAISSEALRVVFSFFLHIQFLTHNVEVHEG